MKDLYTIEPISARAELVIEEGRIEAIIDGYLFDFTIQEISNGTLIILLNSDTTKARNILIEYGASFERKTKDEIHGEAFKQRILDIYRKSNSDGGHNCSWEVDGYDELEYKTF